MARTARTRLPRADAERFRSDFAARWAVLKRRGRRTADLLDVEVPGYPERSERWLSYALDAESELAVETAVELALRIEAIGTRMTDASLELLQDAREPIVVIPKGEAERLVDALSAQWTHLKPAMLELTRESSLRYLRGFERFAETQAGVEIVRFIESHLNHHTGNKRALFTQLRTGKSSIALAKGRRKK